MNRGSLMQQNCALIKNSLLLYEDQGMEMRFSGIWSSRYYIQVVKCQSVMAGSDQDQPRAPTSAHQRSPSCWMALQQRPKRLTSSVWTKNWSSAVALFFCVERRAQKRCERCTRDVKENKPEQETKWRHSNRAPFEPIHLIFTVFLIWGVFLPADSVVLMKMGIHPGGFSTVKDSEEANIHYSCVKTSLRTHIWRSVKPSRMENPLIIVTVRDRRMVCSSGWSLRLYNKAPKTSL